MSWRPYLRSIFSEAARDALGVTSGAITVPFFMAMGLGIASSVRGGAGMGFIFVQEVRRASGWLSENLKSVT